MITSTDPIIIVASNRYDHQRSTQIEKERFILFRLIIGRLALREIEGENCAKRYSISLG